MPRTNPSTRKPNPAKQAALTPLQGSQALLEFFITPNILPKEAAAAFTEAILKLNQDANTLLSLLHIVVFQSLPKELERFVIDLLCFRNPRFRFNTNVTEDHSYYICDYALAMLTEAEFNFAVTENLLDIIIANYFFEYKSEIKAVVSKLKAKNYKSHLLANLERISR